MFSVYLFSGSTVHHRKTQSSQFLAGLEAARSVACECTYQFRMMRKSQARVHGQLPALGDGSGSFSGLITTVDPATLSGEEVSPPPPPLLYLPGMRFELYLLLDSMDLSKLPGS